MKVGDVVEVVGTGYSGTVGTIVHDNQESNPENWSCRFVIFTALKYPHDEYLSFDEDELVVTGEVSADEVAKLVPEYKGWTISLKKYTND